MKSKNCKTHLGNELEVTVENVKSKNGSYTPRIVFNIPINSEKAYYMGRKINLTVEPGKV